MKTERFAISLVLFLLASSAFAQTSADINTYNRYMQKGADQLKTADYPGARDSFNEAVRYFESGSAGHLGLGLAYYYLREDKLAERELSRAAALDPKSGEAWQWLGELAYRNDDLETAVQCWEKAVALNPSATVARARLERVSKEHRTEKDFNRDVTSHFVIKYEGREKIEAGRVVLGILENAYGEVGRALSYYPDRDIQVLLYSSQQFQEVTDAPGWSGGIYDGKIRIPIGGIEKGTPGLRRLLYHEYTHAVVRAIAPRCPVWLNEGLAQYFEGREIESGTREALRRAAQAGKIPPLSQLEGSFLGLSSSQAVAAYLFSLSATKYFIDTHGIYRVKAVLEELGSGTDVAAAIDRGISMSYEDLDRSWKRSLE